MAEKRWYDKRKREGRCTHCGRERDNETLQCTKCREKNRAYKRSATKRRAAQGLCKSCRAPVDNPERRRCNRCLEYNRKFSRRRIEQARETGMCYVCGDPVGTDGTEIHCKPCAEAKRRSQADILARRRANGLCITCARPTKGGYTRCRKCRERTRREIRELKREVFEAYGGAVCACCGVEHLEFLQLDHIKGNGSAHRERGLKGARLYRKLRAASYPAGFQVLCANCNISLGLFGYCPHNPQHRMRYADEDSGGLFTG